jgi:3-oxoacyl-[acyl-carrier protein] reductase
MNSYDLRTRVAVVTGGARGIGRAVVERMIASGALVAIWDRDRDAAAKAVAEIGLQGKVLAVGVDITDEAAVERARAETLTAFGKVDILVNNAGITGPNKKTWEYSLADWNAVIGLDLTGVFLCSRALTPGMIAGQWGRIVNIASVAGKEGNPNAPAYSAAKAAVIALTKSLGKEAAGTGVLVNCVTPAAVATDIFDQMTKEHIAFMLSKIPMGRFGKVEEVAALVTWLASDDCSFSTGATFDLSGGRATY